MNRCTHECNFSNSLSENTSHCNSSRRPCRSEQAYGPPCVGQAPGGQRFRGSFELNVCEQIALGASQRLNSQVQRIIRCVGIVFTPVTSFEYRTFKVPFRVRSVYFEFASDILILIIFYEKGLYHPQNVGVCKIETLYVAAVSEPVVGTVTRPHGMRVEPISKNMTSAIGAAVFCLFLRSLVRICLQAASYFLNEIKISNKTIRRKYDA